METSRRELLIGAAGLLGAAAIGGRAEATGAPLRLVTAPLRAGRSSRVRVSGAPPGAMVSLCVGVGGVGPGPCLGLACLDVAAPVRVVASAAADASGVASFLLPVPAGVAGREVGLQGIVDGTGEVTPSVLTKILGLPLGRTPVNPLGPYFLPNAPVRDDLDLYGEAATPWLLEGHVVSTAGVPMPGVTIEVWHADPAGDYDLTSADMRYRGTIVSGAAGEWCLRTLRPGVYGAPGATRPCHAHIRLSMAGAELLVTQLYPDDDPQVIAGGARAGLVVRMVDDPSGVQRATFTFVL
jgi:protocatechuate 3,4-dioxygenase beta subunit